MAHVHPAASNDHIGSFENESGAMSGPGPESLGIIRQMTETYLVGGFRYTTLSDAVAEARRMAKLESELL